MDLDRPADRIEEPRHAVEVQDADGQVRTTHSTAEHPTILAPADDHARHRHLGALLVRDPGGCTARSAHNDVRRRRLR
jgi:hypothetical protein